MPELLRFHRVRSLLLMGAVTFALFSAGSPAAMAAPRPAPPVPTVNGESGDCTADFVVIDGRQKPIYNAEIDLTFRYGFLNLHKESLEVSTNAAGQARFEGLPNFPKNPLEFRVHYRDRRKTVMDDPGVACHASETVVLP
ncbi:MAG TPA: hypothetical protein VNJ52_03605 [Patescibacteria group bacterium]|nr:hypothetical protein [Patescibacteria group bacterium]